MSECATVPLFSDISKKISKKEKKPTKYIWKMIGEIKQKQNNNPNWPEMHEKK